MDKVYTYWKPSEVPNGKIHVKHKDDTTASPTHHVRTDCGKIIDVNWVEVPESEITKIQDQSNLCSRCFMTIST